MIIAQSGYEFPIICRNDYRNRTYSVDKLLAYAKAAGYNSILLLHTYWNHSREFYVVAYLNVVKDNNDIYLYDMSSGNTLFGGAYLGSGSVNYSQPMVSISDESDGLQSNGAWTFYLQSYQNRTYYTMSYDTYEPVFYTDIAYHDIYINNEKVVNNWINADVGLENQSLCYLENAWESDASNVESDWLISASLERKLFRNGITGIDIRGLVTTSTPDGTHIVFGDNNYGLAFDKSGNTVYFRCYNNGVKNNEPSWLYQLNWGENPPPGLYIFVGINEATQKGSIVMFDSYYLDSETYRYEPLYNGQGGSVDYFNSSFMYEVIKHSIAKHSGGAGSGYIGNSLLSNKKMVGYNVPTSSAESTKTESVQVYSASGEENKPKAGNGMARITFLRSS